MEVFFYYDSAGATCQFRSVFDSYDNIIGWEVLDPFQDYHCPYVSEGYTYAEASLDEDGYLEGFSGPQGQEWDFYEYEQMFSEYDTAEEEYCDSLTDGVDLYKYRWECWITGEFTDLPDSDFCSDTYDLLLAQYNCYDVSMIYTPNFCESDKLTNPEEPTADIFEQCYFDINY